MSVEQKNSNEKPRQNPYSGIIFGIILLLLLNGLVMPRLAEQRIIDTDYGTFIDKVEEGKVKQVRMEENRVFFSALNDEGEDEVYQTGIVNDPELVDRLLNAESPNESGSIIFTKTIPRESSPIINFLLLWVLPGVIFYLIWRQMSKSIQGRLGGGGNVMSFGKSGAKIYADSDIDTTFADVAGQGEAKVPFFSISGSEFVQMFVGMGAAKVRDLFKQATEKAPCIIFIDEIDAIGKKRDSMSSNDEREQTLNQLLTEMDGFDGRKGVVILAATNRPESLDNALLRPGRFDRRIQMELPDLQGRKAILSVHLQKVQHEEIDIDLVARATAGSSGAQLANIVNEAALRAVRLGRDKVTTHDLEESVEVVIAGAQKKGMVISEEEKKIIAYHEIGHAMVAAKQTHSAPVHKITIIPRTSGALGYTMQIDSGEQYLMSRDDIFNRITTLTGGRAAEEIICNTVTTGASNDIERATKMARAMVTRYGMSDKYGMMALETVNNAYLGGDTSLACSDETAADIDKEVHRIINEAHDKARQIIRDNLDKMHETTGFLLEKETITGEEFMQILNDERDR